MAHYEFTVPGKPFGKQRPRVARTGHAYTPKETVSYENLVRMTFVEKYPEVIPTGSPVILQVVAAFPIPQSWPKKKVRAALAGDICPGKPDIDNVLKIIQDALNGIAYKDDALIWNATITKSYAERPGVTVLLEVMEEG